MSKRIVILSLVLMFSSLAYSQAVDSKKCKTCGKPIKECRYKGNHPNSTVTHNQQSSTDAQKFIACARQYYANGEFLKASSELSWVDERYRDGDYWELDGDCGYYHSNSMSSNYWYNNYERAVENGNSSAKEKLLSDIRHPSYFGSIGINANSTEAQILYDKAYREKNMDEKIRLYKSSAAMGFRFAAFNLGRIYEVGNDGVSIDYNEAARYFLLSESLAASKLHLAWLYRHGLGVEKDLTKSFELYSSLAESEVIAMYNVATCYEGGFGVSKNEKMALEYYRKILDKSECESDKRCIEMAAERYYVLTIDRGLVDRKTPTGNYYFNIRSAYAKRKIKQQYWKQAAELGVDCGDYQADIGNYYREENNYSEALKWYFLGAENHDGRACWCLGDFYENGKVVAKNLAEAKRWYEKAVEYGNSSAQRAIDRLKKKGY